MFDIGFSELLFIAVIGIVVVGPKRLPEVVRTVAVIMRKLRRMFSDVKADIERELDLDDMRRIVREADMQAHLEEINRSVMAMDDEVRSNGKTLLRDIDDVKARAEAMMDVYDPALADGEAITGIEPRRDLLPDVPTDPLPVPPGIANDLKKPPP